MNYAWVIDQTKCIGCHACSTACKSENDVPLGVHRTWVKAVEVGQFPNVRRHFALETSDLVRVNTRIGYYVLCAWVTEGIRPGVVACSHHMGRWRTHDTEGNTRGHPPRSRFNRPTHGTNACGWNRPGRTLGKAISKSIRQSRTRFTRSGWRARVPRPVPAGCGGPSGCSGRSSRRRRRIG